MIFNNSLPNVFFKTVTKQNSANFRKQKKSLQPFVVIFVSRLVKQHFTLLTVIIFIPFIMEAHIWLSIHVFKYNLLFYIALFTVLQVHSREFIFRTGGSLILKCGGCTLTRQDLLYKLDGIWFKYFILNNQD